MKVTTQAWNTYTVHLLSAASLAVKIQDNKINVIQIPFLSYHVYQKATKNFSGLQTCQVLVLSHSFVQFALNKINNNLKFKYTL